MTSFIYQDREFMSAVSNLFVSLEKKGQVATLSPAELDVAQKLLDNLKRQSEASLSDRITSSQISTLHPEDLRGLNSLILFLLKNGVRIDGELVAQSAAEFDATKTTRDPKYYEDRYLSISGLAEKRIVLYKDGLMHYLMNLRESAPAFKAPVEKLIEEAQTRFKIELPADIEVKEEPTKEEETKPEEVEKAKEESSPTAQKDLQTKFKAMVETRPFLPTSISIQRIEQFLQYVGAFLTYARGGQATGGQVQIMPGTENNLTVARQALSVVAQVASSQPLNVETDAIFSNVVSSQRPGFSGNVNAPYFYLDNLQKLIVATHNIWSEFRDQLSPNEQQEWAAILEQQDQFYVMANDKINMWKSDLPRVREKYLKGQA